MQMEPKRSKPKEASLTPLLLSVFRLNDTLLTAGDRLVEDLGLTSSKWQLLGAVAEAPVPLTLASLARRRGLSRQGVRIVAKSLVLSGHLQFIANPDHRNAQLAVLTAEGQHTWLTIRGRQVPWAMQIGEGISDTRIMDAVALLELVRSRLQNYERTITSSLKGFKNASGEPA